MLVSFPRDLLVDVPGHGHTRINAAFNDGPPKVIETLKQNFDIPIHHYLEVDFAGFRDLVDAVGGVPIYFTTPRTRHLHGPARSGSRLLRPERRRRARVRAVAPLRVQEHARPTSWHEDPYSDLGRIQRQQYFIRSLAEVAINTAAQHPLKANNILNKAFASLHQGPAPRPLRHQRARGARCARPTRRSCRC